MRPFCMPRRRRVGHDVVLYMWGFSFSAIQILSPRYENFGYSEVVSMTDYSNVLAAEGLGCKAIRVFEPNRLQAALQHANYLLD